MVSKGTASSGRKKDAECFGHVANVMLRSVLQADPRHVRPAAMRQAVSWTLDALGRDVINDAVPALALSERIEAARKADRSAARHRPDLCHRALRRFWSI
jgi:hypothetical protein